MIEGLKLSDGPVANFPEGQITQKFFVTLLEKISKSLKKSEILEI